MEVKHTVLNLYVERVFVVNRMFQCREYMGVVTLHEFVA